MTNSNQVAEAAKAIILEATIEAKRIAKEDEARLGRPLTITEIVGIATMVERQLKLALAMR